LVGWWPFDGNANDLSGNNHNGTSYFVTNTTNRNNQNNSALMFNGIELGNGSTIEINDTILNIGQSQYSISIWFSPNNLTQITRSLFNTNPHTGIAIGFNDNNAPGYCSYGIGPAITYWSTLYNHGPFNNFIPGNWYHVILVKNGTNYYQYINGILDNSITEHTAANFNYPVTIRFSGISSQYQIFDGKLDDIGIWNRALTQQEITNLFNSQLPTQTSLCLPSITTNTPNSIGIDSVIVGGNITNDGGSSIVLRGVCYSTTPNPNMGNMRTEDGSGVGSFSTILRNLNPSTTYYVRSYAKNSNGVVVYGDEVSFSTSSVTIGSFYSGGIVFDLDSTGQHGMVSTPNNLGIFHWGCYGTDITNTSIALGTGESNTTYIMAGCSERPIAASVCADLVLNGFSDWYLPSRDELMMMLDRLHRQGIGGFSHEWYWSSSQINHNGAWAINFNIDGPGGGGMSFMNKSANFGSFRVRGVRTF
jgi:hypothetical protein